MSERLCLNVFEVRQQIGTFYVGKITAEQLVNLSYSDVRKLTDEREVESYLGIQRPLNRNRAKEIQEYVKNIDATFPTSILLSLDSSAVSFDSQNSSLEIMVPAGESPAKVLDGQHRIAGFMNIDTGEALEESCYFKQGSKRIPFELIVTIFVGLDMAEQANVFATVNIKQTKVSKSLVYDLEAYSKTRSPQKTAHEVTLALTRHDKSPFYDKVKRLGQKVGEYETLSQAALVEEIIRLISKNPMKDRDYLLRKDMGMFSSRRRTLERSLYNDNLIFRNAFIDENDSLILKTVAAFFLAVKKRWPKAWDKSNSNSIFNRTVGVNALFRVLREYCKTVYSSERSERIITCEEFLTYFEKSELTDSYFENMSAKTATISKLSGALIY